MQVERRMRKPDRRVDIRRRFEVIREHGHTCFMCHDWRCVCQGEHGLACVTYAGTRAPRTQ